MAKTAAYRILVFRCGATEWDCSGRLQGSTDLPLSAAGLAEVKQAVTAVGRPPLAGVICSPDEASVATAQMLAKAAGGCRVTALNDLREVNFGLWEGILRAELGGRFCRAGRQWDDDPCSVAPPEGESLEALMARVMPALRKAAVKMLGRRSVAAGSAGLVGGEGVGVVLRPVADALVRCVLAGRPSSEVCSVIQARPQAQWFDVLPDQPWELKLGPRSVPSASAA